MHFNFVINHHNQLPNSNVMPAHFLRKTVLTVVIGSTAVSSSASPSIYPTGTTRYNPTKAFNSFVLFEWAILVYEFTGIGITWIAKTNQGNRHAQLCLDLPPPSAVIKHATL